MKSLVVGGDAKLAIHLDRALATRRSSNQNVLTTRRQPLPVPTPQTKWVQLDLLDPRLPQQNGFDVIYIVAAITKLAPCEANPAMAWRVNADGPVSLALQAKQRSMGHVIFLSSEAVEMAPSLVYSRAKAYVEAVLLPLGATIVRPAAMTKPEHYADLATQLVLWGEGQPWGVMRWAP